MTQVVLRFGFEIETVTTISPPASDRRSHRTHLRGYSAPAASKIKHMRPPPPLQYFRPSVSLEWEIYTPSIMVYKRKSSKVHLTRNKEFWRGKFQLSQAILRQRYWVDLGRRRCDCYNKMPATGIDSI